MATPGITQVGIVWSENSNLAAFTSATTPLEISLESQYQFCNNIKGTNGPSTPNYLEASGGSMNGLPTADGSGFNLGTPNNIFQQLQNAGFSWKTYEEGVLYTSAPKSAVRHCPGDFYSFTVNKKATVTTPAGTNNVRSDFTGTAGLTADIANGNLPDFFWISPTDINTGHDLVSGASGNLNHPGQFDQWLQGNQVQPYPNCFPGLTALLAGMRNNSILIIGDDAHNGSTPVVTYYCILCKPPPSPSPPTHSGSHTHLDILYSIQDHFGLPKFQTVAGFPAPDTRYTALTTANLVPFPTPGGGGGGGGGSAPTSLTLPTVTPASSVIVGTALSTDNGTWANTPTSFQYKWARLNTATGTSTVIGGATSSTYTVVSADTGFAIQSEVQATNATGSSGYFISASTNVIGSGGGGTETLPGTTALTGPPQAGGMLTAGVLLPTVFRAKEIGNFIYVGGDFTSAVYPSGSTTRNGLFAYANTSPWALASWNPNADDEVFVIEAGPSGKVFVAGNFANIGGVARNKIAKINDATGSATVDSTFVPGVIDGTVTGLDYDAANGVVWIAGDFTHVGGTARTYFACLDATTGALKPWNVSVTNVITSLHPGRRIRRGKFATDSAVYIVGAFNTVAGVNMTGIAAIDGTPTNASPSLLSWRPDVQGTALAGDAGSSGHGLAIKPDGTKIAVAFAGGGTNVDGNHGVTWDLVRSGVLNRQNTRNYTTTVIGDSGDHNETGCDDTYVGWGHHGNGLTSGNPNGAGNPKCYITTWNVASGSGLSGVPEYPGWIQNQFVGAKGTYSIEFGPTSFLVGGALSAPRDGFSQFTFTELGGGGGGGGGGAQITFQYRVDGGAAGAWINTPNSGAAQSIQLSGLSLGSHLFETRAVDATLGPGPTTMYVWDVVSGTSGVVNPPVLVSATDGTGHDVTTGITTTSNELDVAFTADAGNLVYISTNNGTTYVGPYTSPAVVSGVPVGVVHVAIQARDTSGNRSTPVTFSYTVKAPTTGGQGSGLYQKQIVLPSVAGSTILDTIYVRATDLNAQPIQTIVQRGINVAVPLGVTPPAASILSPVDGSTVFSSDGSVDVLVQATNANDAIGTVSITLDGVSFVDCVQQTDPSMWLGTLDLPVGIASTITATATDADDGLSDTDSVTVLQSTSVAANVQFIPAPTTSSGKPFVSAVVFQDLNQNDVGVVSPQNLEYTEVLNAPPTITFGVNLEDAVSKELRINPNKHDWRLERDGVPIGAGIMAQNGVQIDTDDRTMVINGVGWLGYFQYQFMLYDPTSEITGQNLSFIGADLFNVTRAIIDNVIGGPHSIPITYDHALSGISVNQQFQASDLNDLLTIVNNLGGQVQGFDFEVTPTCHFKMYAPQKGQQSNLRLEWGRNIQRVQYGNPGLKANRVNAVGSGTSSSQTVSLAQNKASQAANRLYTDLAQFSNLTSFNQITGLGKAQLNLDIQDQVNMTVTSRPARGEDQFNLASVGDWVWVDFDLEYVTVQGWYRMTQRTYKPTNEGDEIIDYTFSPNTINSGQ